MSKRLHPIRKLSWAVQRHVHGECDTVDCDGIKRSIARHVKPLLDALASYAKMHYGCRDTGKPCADCRVLAEWKEPLCDGGCGLKRSDRHRHGFGAQREEGR